MLIGIDFDNTIICYDDVFHTVAMERGFIALDVPRNKQAVRDQMRQDGRELEWTLLQGYVYGCRLDDARPFAGVIETIRQLRDAGHDVAIVSHKTRHPYKGPNYDLHAAASDWLAKQGIAGSGGLIESDRAFFEPTKQAKLKRIATLTCDHFIDDLPEFLAEPGFSNATQRWLFDPADGNGNVCRFHRFQHWSELPSRLLAEVAA